MTTYPHICRMDHQEIGYLVGPNIDDERCPLCRSMDACDYLNRQNAQLRARVAEMEAAHPEWMKRIQREREEERERCRAAICAHLDIHEVDHLEGPELDHTIRVVLDA